MIHFFHKLKTGLLITVMIFSNALNAQRTQQLIEHQASEMLDSGDDLSLTNDLISDRYRSINSTKNYTDPNTSWIDDTTSTEKCDTLFTKSGKQMAVRIIDETYLTVKFSLCSNKERTFEMALGDIDSIHYADGSRVVHAQKIRIVRLKYIVTQSASHIQSYLQKKESTGKSIGLLRDGEVYSFKEINFKTNQPAMIHGLIIEPSKKYFDVLIECDTSSRILNGSIKMNIEDLIISESTQSSNLYQEIDCVQKANSKNTKKAVAGIVMIPIGIVATAASLLGAYFIWLLIFG